MIPNISDVLSWLKNNPNILLNGIKRGIERETLRVQSNGYIANTDHPKSLGSALQHNWITTDFAESLLEFITPVNCDTDYIFAFLCDIHSHVSHQLVKTERMWPFSMPCFVKNINKIKLAQYGSSNIGRMKTTYRNGLKNRYGAIMQIIAGVHYNVSFPILFWNELKNIKHSIENVSVGYLNLIRNYYRFGWIIPYLFGASPVISSSFLKKTESKLSFETDGNGIFWLPYATSLRLSNLGYSNNTENIFNIKFNSLEEYILILKKATNTPSEVFSKIGIKDIYGNWLQLNTNILQIENELYLPIRPKRITNTGETISDALLRGGIEYIEVRSLDINPFSAIGIDRYQIDFIDLFLIWCVLADSPKINSIELKYIRENWNRVVLEGRKPNQKIIIGCDGISYPLKIIGEILFLDLFCLAEIFDNFKSNKSYQQVCSKLIESFYNPDLTYSARILRKIKKYGLAKTGMMLSEHYYDILYNRPLKVLKKNDFNNQAKKSIIMQKNIEESDMLDFENYIINLAK